MGCCGKPRKRFIANLKQTKKTPKRIVPKAVNPPAEDTRNLVDIPDEELTPSQRLKKSHTIRRKARTIRIKQRNQRALKNKARNERKALNV